MRNRKGVSLGRHRRACGICHHPQRAEIEADFIAWRSPAAIAAEYDLADRTSVYRHANALGLFPKRQRNVRAALEKIIEKADAVVLEDRTVHRSEALTIDLTDGGGFVGRFTR